MRVVEKKLVTKEVEVTVKDITLCDKCHKEIEDPDMYEKFESIFEISKGEVYPEGGDVDYRTLELCESCTEEAVKLLEDNGFKFVKSNKDY